MKVERLSSLCDVDTVGSAGLAGVGRGSPAGLRSANPSLTKLAAPIKEPTELSVRVAIARDLEVRPCERIASNV